MKALYVTLGSLCLLSVSGCADEGGSFTTNPANCASFCAKVAACDSNTTQEQCQAGCVDVARQANSVSAQCLNAFGVVNACVGQLTCEQGQAWNDEVPPDSYPCKAEDDAASAVCNPG